MERMRERVSPLTSEVICDQETDLWTSIHVVEKAFTDCVADAGGLDNVWNATATIWETIETLVREQKRLTMACIFGMIITYTFWKGRSYGDSWKKYGEKCSIFPNIARKFDRLANIIVNSVGEGAEAKSTTITDLLVYSSLWLTWLAENNTINVMKFVKFAMQELVVNTVPNSETYSKEEKTSSTKKD